MQRYTVAICTMWAFNESRATNMVYRYMQYLKQEQQYFNGIYKLETQPGVEDDKEQTTSVLNALKKYDM